MKHINHIVNLALLTLAGIFFALGIIVLFYLFTPLPDVSNIKDVVSKQSVILNDRNGEFLFNFSKNEQRVFIPIEEISPHIIRATIAVEDQRFYEHAGIDIFAFIRASAANTVSLSFRQGGSTITQQVIKNVLLNPEKKINRKLKEFILAPKLEQALEKEDILELYLNAISFGGVIYGVEEASNVFFKKKARDVTINEAAYLAAILNAPSYFSPYGENLSALEERKDAILALMLNYGDITREEYIGAINEKTGFSSQARFSIKAPHFVFYVQQELENEYGNDLYQLEGSVITTSLDLNLQERIEGLVETTHKSLNNRIKGDNIAALVLSTKTGEILSLVGSKDFFNEEIDGRVNIINSYRQPGSTIKPLIYAAAFSKGLEPETILYDVATQFGPDCDEDDFTTNIEDGCYAPINFTQTFSGPISIRNALAQSINLPAVKTAYLTGLKNIQLFGREIGVSAFNKNVYDYGLSLALGSVDVKPFELAQIYSVFANEGFLVPHTWEKVEKIDSRKRKKVFEKDVAQKITSILTDNEARAPVFGRNSPLNITNIPVASKTGTTNNARDIWVVGYSPDIVVLVWFGNTDGSFIEGEAFGVLLSPLYRDIFTFASATHSSPNTYFSKDSTPTTQKGAPIIYGDLDTQSPHSILHYVDQKDFYKTPKTPEDNIQYPHWEFGVKNWLEENEIQEQESVVPLVEESPSITFNINNPRENIVSKENPLTLTANLIPILNTRYEFYVNGVLAGSSHLPIFIISPSQLVVGETLIRIVGVTPQGTYTTEKYITVQ